MISPGTTAPQSGVIAPNSHLNIAVPQSNGQPNPIPLAQTTGEPSAAPVVVASIVAVIAAALLADY